MNPNAIAFVPSIKLDPEQERGEQIYNIQRQIIYQKQLIQTKNVALTTLHSHLDAKHSVLVNQMKRRENNQFPCLTQDQIDELGKEYREDSKIYYEKYAEFNDATSELVTLQQQLHKLLIINNSCSPPSSPNNNNNIKNNNNNNNNNKNIKVDKDFAKKNKISVKIFDGIDPKIFSPKGSATTTSPQHVLPPIIEDDDETAWNDDEFDDDQCPSMNMVVLDEYNQSVTNTHSLKSSPESVSPTPTPTPTPFNFIIDENGDEKVYNNNDNNIDDKENINPNINPNPNPKQTFDSDEKVNINNNKNKKRIIPDYIAFENKIHTMLENIQYAEINKPCDDMTQIINTLCVNCKCVEILIDMIISHAVEHKPIFFGAKYSLICQSIVNNYKPNRDIIINDIDEYQKMKDLNVRKLVYKSCNETFKKLSYGNDTVKFINVMIIIAELFNADLLDADYIFNTVFQSILCNTHYHDLWENDIEGIFEIFQRCTRHLTQPQHKESLYRYVKIMDKIKNWKKFDCGLKRVPFMINQLKKLVNYKSLEREFAQNNINNNNNNYNGNRYNNNNNNNNHHHRHHHNHHHNNNYRHRNNHHFRSSYYHRHNHHNDYYQKHGNNHNNNNYRRYNNNNNNNNNDRERDIPPRYFNQYNNNNNNNNTNNHNSYRRKW